MMLAKSKRDQDDRLGRTEMIHSGSPLEIDFYNIMDKKSKKASPLLL